MQKRIRKRSKKKNEDWYEDVPDSDGMIDGDEG